MGIYEYLKLAVSGRIPNRVKLLGLWALLVSGRRMAGIFFDPVMACNLRCKMCYMSDPEARKPLKGQRIDKAGFDRIRRAFFKRALKLQIGCATEPTLIDNLPEIIAAAKADGVPYVALTTNGKQIARDNVSLDALAEAGLNELTLSLHGTTREVYEELMQGASFDELLRLTKAIGDAKRRHPELKLRVNYTINSRNIGDLEDNKFWQLWDTDGRPDIVQLRPVQKMGETEWNDFDLTPLKERYDSTIGAIKKKCAELGIACIAPLPDQIDEVTTDQDFTSALIKEITYCYVSPTSTYRPDFSEEDTFNSYHRRKQTGRRLLKAVFGRKGSSQKRDSSKHLNYNVS